MVLCFSIYRKAAQNKSVRSELPLFYQSLNDSDEDNTDDEDVTENGSSVETHKGNHKYNTQYITHP